MVTYNVEVMVGSPGRKEMRGSEAWFASGSVEHLRGRSLSGWSRALRWYSCKRAWEELALIKLPQTRLKFRQIIKSADGNENWVISDHGASALMSHGARMAMGLYLWN